MKNKKVVQPQVGDKVVVPFTSNGNGRIVKSRVKRNPDVIKAIYEDTRTTSKGVVVYSVQLNNGEQVEVVRVDGIWQAIA